MALKLVAALTDDTVKTKSGRNYKPQAKRDIENALRVWVLPSDAIAAKPVTEVRRSDVRALIDRMAREGRSVRNAIAVV